MSEGGVTMRNKAQSVAMCALFTVLIAVGAFLKIPLPLPFTMQLFFVVMSGLLLGSRRGAISAALYMALGLTGLPIFAGGGGVSYVAQPSFGYIIGFVFAAFFVGLIAERKKNPALFNMLLAALVGVAIAYGVGMVYYYFVTNFVLGVPLGVGRLLVICCLITAPADIALSVGAAVLSRKLRRFMPF